jgi:hypothetical protein
MTVVRGPWHRRRMRPSNKLAAFVTLQVACFALGLLIAALFLGGCATVGTSTIPRVGPRVGQEQAVYIIWTEVYGRTDRPPLIRWAEGDQLTCTDPSSGKGGFPQWDGHGEQVCREGITMSPLECVASWHGEDSFGETVMAHEMWHVALARMLIVDDDHLRDDWHTVDECAVSGASKTCGVVDRANRAVIGAGR